MSLKSDLMYPFGNPFKERITQHTTRVALSNVLKLAKDKVRMSHGDIEDILLSGRGGGSADDHIAEQSIQLIENLIQYIDGTEKNTEET